MFPLSRPYPRIPRRKWEVQYMMNASIESVGGNSEVTEVSVMVHDVRDIIEDIDKQICKVRRSNLPIEEKKSRELYLETIAKDNILGNSKFNEMYNGRHLFDYVWMAVLNNSYDPADNDELFIGPLAASYSTFCMDAHEWLELARIAQDGLMPEC